MTFVSHRIRQRATCGHNGVKDKLDGVPHSDDLYIDTEYLFPYGQDWSDRTPDTHGGGHGICELQE